MFTTAHHLSLSWARRMQSVPFNLIIKIPFHILLSMSGSSKWSGSFGLPPPRSVRISLFSHMWHMSCSFHLSLFDQYKSRGSSLCSFSFLQSPGTPSLLGPHIFIITWLSVTILPVLILNKQFVLCCCTAGWDWRHGQVYCWTGSKIDGPSKIGYPSNDYSFSHPVRSSVY